MAKKKIIKKLKNRFRLIIYNDSTFAEVFSLKLSLLNLYAIIGTVVIFFIILGSLLVVYTPIKKLLPSDEYKVRNILQTSFLKVDSLEQIMENNAKNYRRISLILQGKDSLLSQYQDTLGNQKNDTNINFKPIKESATKEDSILKATIERAEKFNITKGEGSLKKNTDLKNLYLHPPIDNGIVVANYENKKMTPHLGIDVTAKKNSHIMSVMRGTVINSNWSVETGYSIIIQHENGFVSCYKHNAELLKKVGDGVDRGEVIAILGNTGEKTTGAHLHFELWYKGKSLNPLDYIVF